MYLLFHCIDACDISFFIFSTSHFLTDLFAQQTSRLEQQNDDQDDEHDSVRKLGGDVGFGEDLDDAHEQAAQQSAGDGTDAAENGCGEGFDARHGAGGGHQGGIGGAEQDACHSCQTRADGKGGGDGGVDVDAHELSGALVLGAGAHGLAHLGLTGEEGQTQHDDNADDDGDTGDIGDGQCTAKETQSALAEDGGEYLGVGGPEQQGCVLEEVADADGSDEHGQRGGGAEGFIGQALNEHTQEGTDKHGQQDAHQRRQIEAGDGIEAYIRTDHDDVTMGEVQHLGDAVHHGVAQCDDGIDAAQADPVDQEIEKCHRSLTPYIFYLYLLSQIISVRNRKGSDPVQSLSVAHCTTRNRPGPPEGCPSLNS